MTSVALLHLDMSCNLILVTFELETRTTANFVQSWTKDIKKVKWYFFQFKLTICRHSMVSAYQINI